MKQLFKTIRFKPDSRLLIDKINEIIYDYQEQGFSLTLRQVYYQLVSKDLIANSEKSYRNIGNLYQMGV